MMRALWGSLGMPVVDRLHYVDHYRKWKYFQPQKAPMQNCPNSLPEPGYGVRYSSQHGKQAIFSRIGAS